MKISTKQLDTLLDQYENHYLRGNKNQADFFYKKIVAMQSSTYANKKNPVFLENTKKLIQKRLLLATLLKEESLITQQLLSTGLMTNKEEYKSITQEIYFLKNEIEDIQKQLRLSVLSRFKIFLKQFFTRVVLGKITENTLTQLIRAYPDKKRFRSHKVYRINGNKFRFAYDIYRTRKSTGKISYHVLNNPDTFETGRDATRVCSVVTYRYEQGSLIHEKKEFLLKIERCYQKRGQNAKLTIANEHEKIQTIPYLDVSKGACSKKVKTVWIAMARIPGDNLKNYLIKNRSMSDLDKMKLYLSILKNYQENNYIHSDIKPSNIMIDKNTQTAKIIDFAFALNKNDEARTRGTYGYIAPELLKPSDEKLLANEKMDIYSLGMVLVNFWNPRISREIDKRSPKNFKFGLPFEEYNKLKGVVDISKKFEKNHPVPDLINSMLRTDPEKRIGSVEKVIEEVKGIISLLENKPQQKLDYTK